MSEEDILSKLTAIETKLDNMSLSSKVQLAKSIGLGLIVAAAGLVNTQMVLAVFLFVGGFILYNYPLSKISKI